MSVEGQSGVLEVFYKRSKAGVKGPRAAEAVLERVEERGEGLGGGWLWGGVHRHEEGVQRAASWEAWIPQEPMVWS